MPKKKTVKRSASQVARPRKSSVYKNYIFIGIALIIIILLLMRLTDRVHVLGAKTGPVLLARGGDDSGSSGSESHNGDTSGGTSGSSGGSSAGSSNNSGSSDTGHTSGGSSNSSGSNGGGSTSNQGSVGNDTQVDCVGPDGKHFTTTFKGCADLNNQWHHSNFSFTPLSTPVTHSNFTTVKVQPTRTEANHPEVETEKLKPSPIIKGKEAEKELHQQNSSDSASSENDTNTEHLAGDEIEGHDLLEDKDVTVIKNQENAFEIHKNNVKAQTDFPLSVNPETHVLQIVTPSGMKEVSVLPDEAVNKVLDDKVLTSVESEASTDAASKGVKTTRLTEINNEPVFEVRGISEKKLLGFIPVGFAKTAFVSATTGRLVKTDETFLNKVLEAVSL
ncbi:hypothetical protein BH09PAT1_BH09PAT1_3160 [soil metagenome]